MQHGDISNESAPRILLVFEGAVGFLPDIKVKDYQRAVRRHAWDDAVSCWELSEPILRRILDLVLRRNLAVEVVTFISQPFADVLAARLDEEDVPVRRVWYSTPGRLSRRLAYMPDVAAVYDPDEAHVFTYGSKGRVLVDPNQLG